MAAQRTALDAHAHELDAARGAAERAWRGGLLDWPTYVAIRNSSLGADLDLIALRQEQARQALALQALLGSIDFDTASSPSAAAHRP
jgi:hypothetical protein